jgi:hypothetical protein
MTKTKTTRSKQKHACSVQRAVMEGEKQKIKPCRENSVLEKSEGDNESLIIIAAALNRDVCVYVLTTQLNSRFIHSRLRLSVSTSCAINILETMMLHVACLLPGTLRIF